MFFEILINFENVSFFDSVNVKYLLIYLVAVVHLQSSMKTKKVSVTFLN